MDYLDVTAAQIYREFAKEIRRPFLGNMPFNLSAVGRLRLPQHLAGHIIWIGIPIFLSAAILLNKLRVSPFCLE